MATVTDLMAVIDAFVSAPKRILGADLPYQWRDGYSQYERVAKFPIEFGGQSSDAARFEVVGFPQSPEPKFRLSLVYITCICRLDYTDETHPNTMRDSMDNVPPFVSGPHYHSWALNRRFFKGVSTVQKLHNAELFQMRSSFDSILRWFCQETNIEQLSGGHLIELPPRDRLL